MANQPWLNEVQRRLAESDLPPAYIRRFMDELADHLQDITEETMNTEVNASSRLGEPSQVSEAAVVAYQQRTFFGRHPSAKFWVFGISPLLSMILAFILACLGMAGVAAACRYYGLLTPLNKDISELRNVDGNWLVYSVSLITIILPAFLLTVAYGRFAKQIVIGRKWILTSCVMLSFSAMLPFHSMSVSSVPGKSQWTIGLNLPPSLLQCVQLCVPLLVGLWFMRPPRKQDVDPNEHLRIAA